MHRCITLGVKHHLRDPGSIPQIDEHDYAVVAPPLTYRLEGVAQGRGSATAWINGQTLRQGQDIEGRTVHIGDGVVRLHQAGRPDIVLRPGQQAGEAGTTPQDVVPSGAVRQRPGR